jgi:hypothetical protein
MANVCTPELLCAAMVAYANRVLLQAVASDGGWPAVIHRVII